MTSLMRWDPFQDLDRFFSDENWGLVPMIRGGWANVAVDIAQTDHDITAEIALPAGVDPAKIETSIEGDLLTIRGNTESTEEQKGKNYLRREIRRGSFERIVRLPAPVKADQADAVYEHGILKITIPKADEAKVKKIQVKVKP